MARVPQKAELDVQVAVRELNDEIRELKAILAKVKASIPPIKEVDELKGAVVRLSKTPTYLDPNDVFRGSGPAHMHGYVPDPGGTPGTAKFLREDGTWQPGSGGGSGHHPDLTGRSEADQHPANAITNLPAGYISGLTVQAALDELDVEKLARSGVQDMLGDLDMGGHAIGDAKNLTFTGGVGEAIISAPRKILMTGIGEVSGVKLLDMSASGVGEGLIDEVREIDMNGIGLIKDVKEIDFTASVGEGIINLPRVIHMNGDDSNNEARIDGLERTVFNDEPTKSVIERPSRLEWNKGVEAGVSYTAAEGQTSWDNVEDTMIVWVASGAGLVAVAVGWAVKIASTPLMPA